MTHVVGAINLDGTETGAVLYSGQALAFKWGLSAHPRLIQRPVSVDAARCIARVEVYKTVIGTLGRLQQSASQHALHQDRQDRR